MHVRNVGSLGCRSTTRFRFNSSSDPCLGRKRKKGKKNGNRARRRGKERIDPPLSSTDPLHPILASFSGRLRARCRWTLRASVCFSHVGIDRVERAVAERETSAKIPPRGSRSPGPCALPDSSGVSREGCRFPRHSFDAVPNGTLQREPSREGKGGGREGFTTLGSGRGRSSTRGREKEGWEAPWTRFDRRSSGSRGSYGARSTWRPRILPRRGTQRVFSNPIDRSQP